MLTQMTLQTLSFKQRSNPAQANSSIERTIEMVGVLKVLSRNGEIYAENEPAQHIYKVVSGIACTCRVLANGRRQIGTFCLPGDVFGLEVRAEHGFSAEAITELSVLVAKRSTLTGLADKDRGASDQLWSLFCRELLMAQERALLLGRTAPERVATFLLQMADRLSCGNSVELPMSRQDIADYLGLTIETVSRTFTCLEDSAAIEIPTSRRIVIRNRGALNSWAT
ncbi:MAG: helix-turn-helix domain-containing protein [Hyphomicrobiaceae bacterium]